MAKRDAASQGGQLGAGAETSAADDAPMTASATVMAKRRILAPKRRTPGMHNNGPTLDDQLGNPFASATTASAQAAPSSGFSFQSSFGSTPSFSQPPPNPREVSPGWNQANATVFAPGANEKLAAQKQNGIQTPQLNGMNFNFGGNSNNSGFQPQQNGTQAQQTAGNPFSFTFGAPQTQSQQNSAGSTIFGTGSQTQQPNIFGSNHFGGAASNQVNGQQAQQNPATTASNSQTPHKSLFGSTPFGASAATSQNPFGQSASSQQQTVNGLQTSQPQQSVSFSAAAPPNNPFAGLQSSSSFPTTTFQPSKTPGLFGSSTPAKENTSQSQAQTSNTPAQPSQDQSTSKGVDAGTQQTHAFAPGTPFSSHKPGSFASSSFGQTANAHKRDATSSTDQDEQKTSQQSASNTLPPPLFGSTQQSSQAAAASKPSLFGSGTPSQISSTISNPPSSQSSTLFGSSSTPQATPKAQSSLFGSGSNPPSSQSAQKPVLFGSGSNAETPHGKDSNPFASIKSSQTATDQPRTPNSTALFGNASAAKQSSGNNLFTGAASQSGTPFGTAQAPKPSSAFSNAGPGQWTANEQQKEKPLFSASQFGSNPFAPSVQSDRISSPVPDTQKDRGAGSEAPSDALAKQDGLFASQAPNANKPEQSASRSLFERITREAPQTPQANVTAATTPKTAPNPFQGLKSTTSSTSLFSKTVPNTPAAGDATSQSSKAAPRSLFDRVQSGSASQPTSANNPFANIKVANDAGSDEDEDEDEDAEEGVEAQMDTPNKSGPLSDLTEEQMEAYESQLRVRKLNSVFNEALKRAGPDANYAELTEQYTTWHGKMMSGTREGKRPRQDDSPAAGGAKRAKSTLNERGSSSTPLFANPRPEKRALPEESSINDAKRSRTSQLFESVISKGSAPSTPRQPPSSARAEQAIPSSTGSAKTAEAGLPKAPSTSDYNPGKLFGGSQATKPSSSSGESSANQPRFNYDAGALFGHASTAAPAKAASPAKATPSKPSSQTGDASVASAAAAPSSQATSSQPKFDYKPGALFGGTKVAESSSSESHVSQPKFDYKPGTLFGGSTPAPSSGAVPSQPKSDYKPGALFGGSKPAPSSGAVSSQPKFDYKPGALFGSSSGMDATAKSSAHVSPSKPGFGSANAQVNGTGASASLFSSATTGSAGASTPKALFGASPNGTPAGTGTTSTGLFGSSTITSTGTNAAKGLFGSSIGVSPGRADNSLFSPKPNAAGSSASLFAPKTAAQFGADGTSDSQDTSDAPASDADEQPKDPQTSLTDLNEAEVKDNEVVFESRKARYMSFNKESKAWDKHGSGPFRVLKNKSSGKARILVRQEPSGKIIINSNLIPGAKYESPQAGKLRFTVSDGEGKLNMWLATLPKEVAREAAEVLEKNKAAS